MTTTIAFTPESVRDTLLAAGFPSCSEAEGFAGFYIRAWPSTIYVTWAAEPSTPVELESMHARYRDALRQAGFRVGVQAACVPVNGLRDDRPEPTPKED